MVTRLLWGMEGGFAPDLKNAEEVLDYLMRAVKEAGYEPGSTDCVCAGCSSQRIVQ